MNFRLTLGVEGSIKMARKNHAASYKRKSSTFVIMVDPVTKKIFQ